MNYSQDDKALDVDHVELARKTSSGTDLAPKADVLGGVTTLSAVTKGKVDAAMEILHGERVEMTDEQVTHIH